MEIEYTVKVLPVDENLPSEVTKLAAAGWQTISGVTPMAFYPMVRIKPQPVGIGMGEMVIDESKVQILRANGQLE